MNCDFQPSLVLLEVEMSENLFEKDRERSSEKLLVRDCFVEVG